VATLPTGTVTFLFTDIEGSTRLLHDLGERYPEVLSEHRRALRAAATAHHGVEVDTQGDAFFIAFAQAADAVAAATDAQRALGTGPVRVRMGLHTGEPALREGGYVGMDVHRGARICAAGHGGQVLLSATTRAALGPDAPLKDLGEHRLKDLPTAEWLFQLVGPQLHASFPPLRSLNNTNLPASASSLIGRERELVEIGALLSGDDVRLVTLTGPGGTGKTRLALRVAASLVEQFRNGVFLVEMAAVTEAAQVLPTVARTLGAKESGADWIDTLRRALEGKSTLLVLDNLEQVIDAAPNISRLLEAAPGLRVLATSRERLRIGGEHEYPVDPLPVDAAVELFAARARAVVPAFALNGQRAFVVAICRRLDGLPLAVELAAAQVKLFTPQAMLTRLDQHVPVLATGDRDLPARQQTIAATIGWSYALLGAEEKRIFSRLSVFVGGFTAEGAEVVCGAGVDVLASLLDKSLLRQRTEGAGPRLFMLETIREYAAERLAESGEADEWRGKHARYHAATAERAQHEMLSGVVPTADEVADVALEGGPNESVVLDELARERDNLTAALEWFIDRQDARSAVAFALNLVRLWIIRGTLADGRKWTERVIDLDGAQDVPGFAWLLTVAAEFPRWQGDLPRARALLERATLGLSSPADELRREAAQYTLAVILAEQNEVAAPRALLEAALARARRAGDPGRTSQALNGLAIVAFYERDYERMAAFADEELELARRSRSLNAIVAAALDAGEAYRHLGDLRRAATNYQEAAVASGALHYDAPLAGCIEGLGHVAAALGDAPAAVTLWAAAERVFGETGYRVWDADGRRQAVERARTEMGDEAFEAAWTAGRALTMEDAVARASTIVARAVTTTA
jgi:predicted ATPase/class 3 adenylate cyclase